MIKRTLIVSTLIVGLSLSAGFTLAVAVEPVKEEVQAQEEKPFYGSHLMTQEERSEYRAKMRAATSAEEREQIRKEHHDMMQVRAKERGVKLPEDAPIPVNDSGIGSGGGSTGSGGSGGMGGFGGGMRSGGGRGR